MNDFSVNEDLVIDPFKSLPKLKLCIGKKRTTDSGSRGEGVAMIEERECLSQPCDTCGRPVDGGVHHCPKCNISFCFYCVTVLIRKGFDSPIKCPMCGGKFE